MEAQGVVTDHSSNGFRRGSNRRDRGGHRNSGGYQQKLIPTESSGSSIQQAAVRVSKGHEGIGESVIRNEGSYSSQRNAPPPGLNDDNRAWSKVHNESTKPNQVRGTKFFASSGGSSGVRGSSSGAIPAEQNFVAYLPQDDAVVAGLGERDGGVDASETQEVTEYLNEQLSALLCLPPRLFWRKVIADETLSIFLDSYLQFRRRWFDNPPSAEAKVAVVAGDGDLSRRAFMVLLRLSSNGDPGTSANESLSAKEHATILKEKKFLDIPKLMDVSAIYGHDNPDLTRRLVSNVFEAQPGYADELASYVPPLLQRIITMHQRCCDTIQALSGSKSPSDLVAGDRIYQELLEIVDYLNDVVITLNAFILVYPPAAEVLVTSGNTNSGQGLLLPAMATIYDTLLPNLKAGFGFLASSHQPGIDRGTEETAGAAQVRLDRVGERLVDVMWLLIENCYLNGTSEHDDLRIQTTSSISYEDAVAKGDALVQATVALALGPSESADMTPGSGASRLICTGALLKRMERRHGLSYHIQQACTKGSVHLDDAQQEYLSALMVDDNPTAVERHVKRPTASNQDLLRLTLPEREGDEEAVIRQSKISQIKDLFPDYGDGFVDACLEVYDNDPEKVIVRILEGTLHPDLLSLDTSIATKPVRSAIMQPVKDKGKAKINDMPLPEAESVWEDKPIPSIGVSSSLTLPGSSSSAGGYSGQTPPVDRPTAGVQNAPNAGRYVRRQKEDNDSFNDLLDSRNGNEELRVAIKAAAAKVEYEDEYDDSFDELGQYVADTGGVEETESLVDLVGNRGGGRGDSSHSRGGGRPMPLTPWGSSSPRERQISSGAPHRRFDPQRGDRQPTGGVSRGTSESQRGDRQYSANISSSYIEAQRGDRKYPEGQRGDRQFSGSASRNTSDPQRGDKQNIGNGSRGSSGYENGPAVPEAEEQVNERPENLAGGRGRGGRGNRGRGKNRGPQPKSEFYLKDGKVYSYKVAGSVGVGSVEEAEEIKREVSEAIYGLGAGGNVPRQHEDGEVEGKQEGSGMGEGGRGRGGFGRGRGGDERGGRGRGRGENSNHHRKDRAMKKHFAGLSGM